VADRGRGPVHRRDVARGARRPRRPARGTADPVAANVRARTPDRARARNQALPLRAGRRSAAARGPGWHRAPGDRSGRHRSGGRTRMTPAGRTGTVDAVPTGNTFDKYGSTNPVVRRLMSGFERSLAELFDRAAPESLLDVGCGEGVLTRRWAEQLPG